jgi:hypothetical protein
MFFEYKLCEFYQKSPENDINTESLEVKKLKVKYRIYIQRA